MNLYTNSLQSTNDQHPITALATPFAKSAIAVIRVSGRNCISMLYPILQFPHKKPATLKPRQASLCNIIDPKTQSTLDSCLVTAFPAPHSYTGEDCAEISIHGSTVGIEKTLSLLSDIGFETAKPGEFTLRAFLNGKLDLTQAEAIHTIIESHSKETHTQAVEQLSGTLTEKINEIKNKIKILAATCAVSLDYPDDEIQESTIIDLKEIDVIISLLKTLIQTYDFAKIQKTGAKIVIAGQTNAGKSSLFNCLLKQDRAIVNEQHGTTRDYIEYEGNIKGIPIRLFDTAGLRQTNDSIEQHGITLSHSLMSSADIILFVIDSTCGWTSADEQTLRNIDTAKPVIIIWNKTDEQKSKNYTQEIPQTILEEFCIYKIIPVSTKEYTHINSVQEHIYKSILTDITLPKQNDVIISNERQYKYLCNCLHAIEHVHEALHTGVPLDMISLDIDIALKALGSITGEVSTEDILDAVFSNFCVGK